MTAAPEDTAAEVAWIEAEAVRITQELIRIDSTNYGDGSGPGEGAAADYVCNLLREVGLDPTCLESEPGRASVVVRLPGADPTRPGLVLHGHLDVVPATAADWSVDPFSGEIRDGMIWGRGAVDMKDMVAMMLANVRHLARTGTRPPRDVVVAFFADEEAGGTLGAQWLVTHHPELFAGCSEAVSEVGGYSITLPARDTGEPVRAYLLQTAEKGFAWVHLRATGRAGHGSVPNHENAIVRLARAIDRIDAHVWPREFVAAVDTLFDGVSRLTGVPRDEEHLEELLPLLGGARQFVIGTLQDSATPTMLTAGYKNNVIPGSAEAAVDCRFLPGHQDLLLDTLRELAGEHVEVIVDKLGIAVESPTEGPFVDAMRDALLAEDPEGHVLPYCLTGGTDNKALKRLGIDGYGFAPLQLPPDLDFAPLFHGVDERVPVSAVEFGARVLKRLLETC